MQEHLNEDQHDHKDHKHGDDEEEPQVLLCGLNVAPIALLIALGFHCVFEGIALGLIQNLSVFVDLIIGITIHHGVACISYGVSLSQSRTKSKKVIILSVILLSTFQSTGLSIGIGLGNSPDLVGAIILSFAGGTFIYISCGEILSHEFDRNQPMWLKYVKFLMYMFGASIITVMWLLDLDDI